MIALLHLARFYRLRYHFPISECVMLAWEEMQYGSVN